MRITPRPYRGAADLDALRRFLMTARTAVDRRIYLHPGDVVWRIADTLVDYDPRDIVLTWAGDDDTVAGFALLYPMYSSYNLCVHPKHRGEDTEAEMLLATEAALEQLKAPDVGDQSIQAWDVFAADLPRLALLEANGYTKVTDDWCVATRPLDGDIPAPHLPAGYAFQHVASKAEVERRIAHRDDLTVDDYEKLRNSPGYDPTLDLMAVSSTGDVAAYCICWLDPESREGEIEPLGTRPEHRQRGLGRAVVLEALQRMQGAGMRQAMVCYDRENLSAERLYGSLDFRLDARLHAYTRQS